MEILNFCTILQRKLTLRQQRLSLCFRLHGLLILGSGEFELPSHPRELVAQALVDLCTGPFLWAV